MSPAKATKRNRLKPKPQPDTTDTVGKSADSAFLTSDYANAYNSKIKTRTTFEFLSFITPRINRAVRSQPFCIVRNYNKSKTCKCYSSFLHHIENEVAPSERELIVRRLQNLHNKVHESKATNTKLGYNLFLSLMDEFSLVKEGRGSTGNPKYFLLSTNIFFCPATLQKIVGYDDIFRQNYMEVLIKNNKTHSRLQDALLNNAAIQSIIQSRLSNTKHPDHRCYHRPVELTEIRETIVSQNLHVISDAELRARLPRIRKFLDRRFVIAHENFVDENNVLLEFFPKKAYINRLLSHRNFHHTDLDHHSDLYAFAVPPNIFLGMKSLQACILNEFGHNGNRTKWSAVNQNRELIYLATTSHSSTAMQDFLSSKDHLNLSPHVYPDLFLFAKNFEQWLHVISWKICCHLFYKDGFIDNTGSDVDLRDMLAMDAVEVHFDVGSMMSARDIDSCCGFKSSPLKKHDFQMPHTDHEMQDLHENHPQNTGMLAMVGFAPINKDGMDLHGYHFFDNADRNSANDFILHIPHGQFVMAPATFVHAGFLRPSLSTNLRLHFYVFIKTKKANNRRPFHCSFLPNDGRFHNDYVQHITYKQPKTGKVGTTYGRINKQFYGGKMKEYYEIRQVP